jgi:hypothetical protein
MNTDSLPASCLRVLAAVLELHGRGPLTVRRLARRLGSWPAPVCGHLRRLEAAGLVDLGPLRPPSSPRVRFEARRRFCGVVRPTCTFTRA